MKANFTPGLLKGHFRYWCQHNLPAVYDDSLSYYELLCKISHYLSLTMDNVDELLKAYQQLENYVNHYFDNLDVQEEINNKLDQMAADGTLNLLTLSGLHGKTAIFFGDSLMVGTKADGSISEFNIPKMFGVLTGATIINKAVNGAGFGIEGNSIYSQLVNAQNELASADYIFISGGTNDANMVVPMGGCNNTGVENNTYVSGINKVLIYVNTYRKPAAKVFILTQPMTAFINENLTRNIGYSASLSYRATRYGFPVIDLTSCIGLNSYSNKWAHNMQSGDNVHFTDEGYKYLSEMIYLSFANGNYLKPTIGGNIATRLLPIHSRNKAAYLNYGNVNSSFKCEAGRNYSIYIRIKSTGKIELNIAKTDNSKIITLQNTEQNGDAMLLGFNCPVSGEYYLYVSGQAEIYEFYVTEYPNIPNMVCLTKSIAESSISNKLSNNGTARNVTISDGSVNLFFIFNTSSDIIERETLISYPRIFDEDFFIPCIIYHNGQVISYYLTLEGATVDSMNVIFTPTAEVQLTAGDNIIVSAVIPIEKVGEH